MNMSLGTVIYMEHYMNIMNMFFGGGTLHQGDLKTFVNEKHLGHTKHYEHVFMGMLVSNI